MQTTDASNASNNGRQRGRRNNSRRAFNRPSTATGIVKTSKFEGQCDELKGHVYDCSNPRQTADKFTRTTKEIAEYTGVKYGAEVKLAIETLKKTTIPVPVDPPKQASVTQMRIWEHRVNAEITLDSDLKKAYSLVLTEINGL